MSGQAYPTISMQPVIYDLMEDHCLKVMASSTSATLKDAAKKILTKLRKYQNELCGILPTIAQMLEPRVSSKLPRCVKVNQVLRKLLIKDYGLKKSAHLPLQQVKPAVPTKHIF